MKTFLLCIIFCFSYFQEAFAQVIVTNAIDPEVLRSIDMLQNRPNSNSFQSSTINTVLVSQNFGNNVQIRQIGNYNYVQAALTANDIELDITQKGDKNQIYLNRQAKEINHTIWQEGNNNRINDFASFSNYASNNVVIQKGNNQSFTSFGTNSFSRDMQIRQTGNGTAIIIINK
jgi:minor curlin subunit